MGDCQHNPENELIAKNIHQIFQDVACYYTDNASLGNVWRLCSTANTVELDNNDVRHALSTCSTVLDYKALRSVPWPEASFPIANLRLEHRVKVHGDWYRVVAPQRGTKVRVVASRACRLRLSAGT